VRVVVFAILQPRTGKVPVGHEKQSLWAGSGAVLVIVPNILVIQRGALMTPVIETSILLENFGTEVSGPVLIPRYGVTAPS
jgi:hypothetical protein